MIGSLFLEERFLGFFSEGRTRSVFFCSKFSWPLKKKIKIYGGRSLETPQRRFTCNRGTRGHLPRATTRDFVPQARERVGRVGSWPKFQGDEAPLILRPVLNARVIF